MSYKIIPVESGVLRIPSPFKWKRFASAEEAVKYAAHFGKLQPDGTVKFLTMRKHVSGLTYAHLTVEETNDGPANSDAQANPRSKNG